MSGKSQRATPLSSWRTLLQLDPLSPSVVFTLLASSAASTIAYDLGIAGFTEDNIRTVTLIFLASASVFVLASWLTTSIASSLLSVIAHAVLTHMVFVGKGLTTALWLYPDSWWDAWLIRLPGDITVTMVAWLCLAIVTSHRREFVALREAALAKQQHLQHQRERRRRVADELDLELRRNAIVALQPPIDAITAYLKRAGAKARSERVSQQLESLIDDTVRPLSRSLSQEMGQVRRAETVSPVDVPRPTILQLRIRPDVDLKTGLVYLLSSLNVFVTIAQLSSLAPAFAVLGVSTSLWALLAVLRMRWQPEKDLAFLPATFLLTCAGTVAYLPTGLTLWYFSLHYPALAPIVITACVIYMFVPVVSSIWHALTRSRREELTALEQLTVELDRELGLTNQAIWVVKRKWSYLIHGSVQSALTIAMAKLRAHQKAVPVEEIVAGLNQAKEALSGFFERDFVLTDMLDDIVESWQGVCAVHFAIEANALAVVAAENNPRVSLNEIVKEGVSNAHRHGGATEVTVGGGLDADGNLAITITNNGQPIDSSATPSVGFAMFEQLCIRWSVREDRQGCDFLIAVGAPASVTETSAGPSIAFALR